MSQPRVGRRAFITGAALAGAASAVEAQTPAPAAPKPAAPAKPAPTGYTFLKPAEAAFAEAVSAHMIPADELTADGVALGIPVYMDRALAGAWGKGERLFMQGPWAPGTPNQGYQLPLTPAELFRAGVKQANAYCRTSYGRTFDRLATDRKEAFLLALSRGQAAFPSGLPSGAFFELIYRLVMEGLFADPVYGGNRDKAGWAMVGFPGVMANNARNVEIYRDGRRFEARPVSIADMS
jgi:gluconate 2-dehydrogenase gamma chain